MVRIKERYLLVNVLYPTSVLPKRATQGTNVPDFVALHQPTSDQLTPQSLLKGIRQEVSALFGDYGFGVTEGNLSVKYLSNATSTIILRVRRSHYRLVWAALTTMDHVPLRPGAGKPCIFRVIKVSGTIRKAEEEATRQARHLVLAARSAQSLKDSHRASTLPALLSSSSTQDAGDSLMLDVDSEGELEDRDESQRG